MARILLIDDSYDVLKMLEMMLSNRGGYEVFTSENGPDGLQLAQEHHPDLAIVDVMMPGMNGYEVVKQLRNDPRTQDIAILILTGRGQPVDQEAALKAGADDYLAKPVPINTLLERVENLLAKAPPAPEPTSTRLLPVFSLRGGSGATTLAVNLASLFQLGGPTVLVDLSPNSGHCALYLGMRPDKHWGHYLQSPEAPIDTLLLKHASGLRLLAAPMIPFQDGWFSDADLQNLLAALETTARYIVLDMPPVYTPQAEIIFERAHRILVVSGDDPPGIQTTIATLRALAQWKNRLLIARNILTTEPHPPLEALRRTLHTQAVLDIPYAQEQRVAARKGIPLSLAQPKSPFAVGLRRTAQLLLK